MARAKKPIPDPTRENLGRRPPGWPAQAPDVPELIAELDLCPDIPSRFKVLAGYGLTADSLQQLAVEQARARGGIYAFQPFPKQLEVMQAMMGGTVMVGAVIGANRASKSCVGAVVSAYKALGSDLQGQPLPARDFSIWIGGVTEEKTKNICMRKLIENAELKYARGKGGFLPAGCYKHYKDRDVVEVQRIGGGKTTITFKSYAQWLRDRASWESESVQFAWLDEPPPEELYDACLVRLLDEGGQILITATDLSRDEIPWFYTRIVEPATNGTDPRLYAITLRQDDNIYLDKTAKDFIRSQIRDPAEYASRIEGEIGALSGRRCIFNSERIAAEKRLLRRPVWEGEILGVKYKDARLNPLGRGLLRIFAQPVPEGKYIVSGDASSGTGTKNTDPAGIVVLRRDVLPLEIVCSWIGFVTPRTFGRVLLPFLGRYYSGNWASQKEALLILDTHGGDGKEAMRYLRDWEDDGPAYQHLYRRQNFEPTPQEYGEALLWGFDTNRSTRPLLLGAVREYFDEGMLRLADERILNQFRTFITYEDGVTQKAAVGAHDELAMCVGQALLAHESAPGAHLRPRVAEEQTETGECQRAHEAHEAWKRENQMLQDHGIYD